MPQLTLNKNKTDKLLFWIAMFIMAAGIITRIIVLIQNRNLIIDECNIARNIYERNFAGLVQPLNYEQYAPPVFLWMLKICTSLFGMGEQALRLYPLLAGIGAIIMMYLVLKELTSLRSLWYPLALFIVAHTFIRYSTEVKQYMPDALISLSLIWLSLKIDIRRWQAFKFIVLWSLIGSVAIWASMPAVFMLTGVGAYYAMTCIQHKEYKRLLSIIIVGIMWLGQFAFYYYKILKPQIDSDYLQNYHHDYFLFFSPHLEHWKHNYYVCVELLKQAGGYDGRAVNFNSILMLAAIAVLLYKQKARGLLITMPLLAAIVAAMAHKYSLIPRVALFMMPLLLILVGFGFELLMRIRFSLWRGLLTLFAIFCIHMHNSASKMIAVPFVSEEITRGLRFLEKENVTGDRVYAENGARPGIIYYTQINPRKDRWAHFAAAHLLSWDVNFDAISAAAPTGRIAFIYTGISPDDLARDRSLIGAHLKEVNKMEQPEAKCFVYVYEKQ